MAPLTRNKTGKYKSERVKNILLKINLLRGSQKLRKIEKKKTNNYLKNLLKNKKELIKFDIIKNLPLECSQTILLGLSKDDVAFAYNCNRNWRYVMSGDYFWKKRCQLDNYHVADENNTSKFFQQHLQKFDCYWQGLYSYYDALLNNWKNNDFKKISRSADQPRQIHYLDEKILIVSTEKFTLKMIDSSTGNKIKTKLGGHRQTISKVYKIENYLVSFSYDSSFKVWDLSQDGLCIASRSVPGNIGNTSVAKNLIAFDNQPSNEILVYDFKGTLIYRQDINLFYAFSVCVYDNIVAIAGLGGNVKILEFNSKNSTQRIISVPCRLCTVKIINGYLLCISCPGEIYVYDAKTLTYLHTIGLYYNLKCIDQNKIVFNDLNKHFVTVSDITTGRNLLQIKNQHVMHLIASNNRFIVTEVPYKKLIKVWCCNTSQLVTEISLQEIGLKNNTIITAFITDSKLALLCFKKSDYRSSRFLVLLNFENDKNVLIKY